MKIELKNIGKSIAEKKIMDLFNLANNNSNIIKDGHVMISKESTDIFDIEHNKNSIGKIQIHRKGNVIKHYTVTLQDRSGVGDFKMPHTYWLRMLAKDVEPEYEEWTHTEIQNGADMFIFYKIFHDNPPIHHYEVDVLNYENKCKIKNLKARVVNNKEIANKEYAFDVLFLKLMAFKYQDMFIELFNTVDFEQALTHEKIQQNLNVLKMYHI
jgi:hypothetical protein